MHIGMAYDTADMYADKVGISLHHDFSAIGQIVDIKEAFEKLGHRVSLLGNAWDILSKLNTSGVPCDLVYNTAEGIRSRNREGLVPSLLEIAGIPYLGTDAYGLSLSLNKYHVKILAERNGILTPKFCYIPTGGCSSSYQHELRKLTLPVIIKPNTEGNSTGIVLARSWEGACRAIDNVAAVYGDVICEEFIYGKEITVPVIGNDLCKEMIFAVTGVDLQDDGSFVFDTYAKTLSDYSNLLLDLDGETEQRFKQVSQEMFALLNCRDFARFDYRLTPNEEIYFIEANPLPSLFRGGSFDLAGRRQGMSFEDMLSCILATGCKRLGIHSQ